ncbi:hypothetical protein [Paenibacillus brasilensis]|uniref:Uncharacterized protein n=1 Tax=Paenibacillus brasilensis TaxID=128574 RepID=A0ABU0KX63_9BACL|nr:hypothetical protein [Paenibacillus brasilensis]MDQ0494027.1 hypothetical protein [Paenibacillus brasilensis]
MDGWIKLHRKILKSPVYRLLNSKQRDVMMTILLLANHESNTWEFRGEVYEVEPGQFITSLDSLKETCASDVTTQNIRTALLKLEKHGFLTNESTKKNRLITVVNWGFYQGSSVDSNKEINRQPTNSQQTANKQLTTNKNDKNLKNDKNDKKKDSVPKIKFAEFVKLTQQEYDKLVLAHGEDRTKRMIEILDNYKGSKGKKYASDYRAILNWVVERVEEEEQKGGYRQAKPFAGGQAASQEHDANSQVQANSNGGAVTDSGSSQQDRVGAGGNTDRSTGTSSKYDIFVRR